MTGRNDPCPCGSGRKYKKCCDKGGVVSIGLLLAEELRNVQQSMLMYTEEVSGVRMGQEYRQLLQQYPNHMLETMGGDFLSFLAMCVQKDKTGKTLMERFIQEYAADLPRERMKEIVRSWRGQARFLSGTVEEIGDEIVIIRDVLTGQKVHVAEKEEAMETKCYVHGILLPYEQQFIFLMIPIVQMPERNIFRSFFALKEKKKHEEL